MALAKAAQNGIKKTMKFFIGECMPTQEADAARVKISQFVFDENLHMHFREFQYIYAHDPQKLCKTGDLVLVQSLPKNLTRLIKHQVVEVVFPLGNITDPITGKKVAATVYRDDIKMVNEMYGKSETGFDYDKAKPRGSLEDTKDFTNKPVYKKYREDDPSPYAI